MISSSFDLQDIVTIIPKEQKDYIPPASAQQDGMIILTQKADGSYEITSNFRTDNLNNLLQMTSIIGTVNYYAMAVAGTIMGSSDSGENSKAAVAGSVSMMFNDSVTEAKLGDNLNVNLTDGNLDVKAQSQNNTRLIGGAVSASTATAGVGVNVAVLVAKDKVNASIGDNGFINVYDSVTEDGTVNVIAENKTDIWLIGGCGTQRRSG